MSWGSPARLLRLAAGGAIGWVGGRRVQRRHPLHKPVGLPAKMGLTAKSFLRQDIIHEGVAHSRCVLLATMRASNRDRVAPGPRKGLRVGGKDRGYKPVSFRAAERKTVRCRRPLHDHLPSGTKMQEAGGSTAAAVTCRSSIVRCVSGMPAGVAGMCSTRRASA
jgi:hypothetical protein